MEKTLDTMTKQELPLSRIGSSKCLIDYLLLERRHEQSRTDSARRPY